MVTPALQATCDIFCRVIDNYGDIGVCLRLARQLHDEHDWQIRLWVDDSTACAQLTHGTAFRGIEVREWLPDFPKTEPADVVVEAFACELPESYLHAMATLPEAPVWLNLEYLCVEDWGPGFHLQPSPHPRLPLLKHFFVPGILPGTGGTLCEADLLTRQAAFDASAARSRYTEDTSGRWTFLFCYDNPALPMLLDAWAEGEQTVHCLVSAGKASAQCAAWLGQTLVPGQAERKGRLHLHPLPFVTQQAFDTLLWTCDLNFVRGEDSFCRAQWAGLPLVWQIYPQQDDVHFSKLADFAHHNAAPVQELTGFTQLWNGVTQPTPTAVKLAWQALDAELPVLRDHAARWRSQLTELGDLAGNLVRFVEKQGKTTPGRGSRT